MFEEFSIFDISKEEHKLVMTARDKYGEAFDIANSLIKFLSRFIGSVNHETYVFISYLSLTYNSLWLGLLSAIRMHQVQAAMNMRQALEAGVKAAYALTFPDADHFVIQKNDGTLEERENLKQSCYKWLEKSYPKKSNTTKFLKKSINKLFAHANFITTQNITKFSDGKFWVMIFDQEDTLLVKASLWLLANIAFGLIDLFARVSSKTKNIRLVPDFETKISKYSSATEKIKQELMTHSRFSKLFR